MTIRWFCVAAIVCVMSAGVLWSAKPEPQTAVGPQYTNDGRLLRPENYREWIYLSSGLGMSYSGSGAEKDPKFTNVFVTPEAYKQFVNTGKWPDKTMFVVEDRDSTSKGSINKRGRFQTGLAGFGVEVKDESRFPEKWAYFNFDQKTASSAANPKGACWRCHNDNAAVENTFVQFYPTLKPIAQRFGVYKHTAEDSGK